MKASEIREKWNNLHDKNYQWYDYGLRCIDNQVEFAYSLGMENGLNNILAELRSLVLVIGDKDKAAGG